VTGLRRAFAVCAVLLSGCAIDPAPTTGGLPTLDDAGPADGIAAVTAGREHTCALTASGIAYCWGSNQFGQLGAPSDTTCFRADQFVPCRLRPVAVTGGLSFQKLSAGGKITCGISTAARIYCWGDNLRGGLGDPAYRESATPIPVASSATFSDVAAGAEHACGLRTDGVLLCWGWNDMGQLGNNTAGSGSATPVLVNGNLRFVSVSAGDRRTCARQSDGATFCWGVTWVSTVGIADGVRPQTVPQRVQIPAAPVFTSVSAGSASTCGITPDLRAFCWESNPAGSIGDGTAAGSDAPRAVLGSSRYVSISSGGMHTCAVDDAGMAHCWGAGNSGQLGVPSTLLASQCMSGSIACSTTPVRVAGWRQFASVSAGQGDHACGLTLAGNLYCWGAGSLGQLGTGRRFPGDWAPNRVRLPL
jgi:alpha-tubulin suppressor-like RCC1 family protein